MFVVIIISVFLGLAIENYRSSVWLVNIPVSIAVKQEKETPDFNYDHYYSLEATDNLTDSLEEWLKNPAVLSDIQNQSKAVFRSADLRIWENKDLKVRKKAPQFIEITFYAKSEEAVKRVSESIKKQIDSYLDANNQSGKPYFYLTNSSSEVEWLVPRWTFISFICFLWGILLAILIILEKHYRQSSLLRGEKGKGGK